MASKGKVYQFGSAGTVGTNRSGKKSVEAPRFNAVFPKPHEQEPCGCAIAEMIPTVGWCKEVANKVN